MVKFITNNEHKRNEELFESTSPGQLRIVDAYTFLDDMWVHLMKDEPSMERIEICKQGHKTATQLLKLYLNENIIKVKVYKALAESIQLRSSDIKNVECKETDCACRIVKMDVHLNIQLYIELEIRVSTKIKEEMVESSTLNFTGKIIKFQFNQIKILYKMSPR